MADTTYAFFVRGLLYLYLWVRVRVSLCVCVSVRLADWIGRWMPPLVFVRDSSVRAWYWMVGDRLRFDGFATSAPFVTSQK